MRILFTSYHKYPGRLHGVAAHCVHDYLVKGLAELGHEVYYKLKENPIGLLPEGVHFTSLMPSGVDLIHLNDGPVDGVPETDHPWVRILHSDLRIQGKSLDMAVDNWIYVSQTLATLYGSDRYVYNGIDPDEFIYSETKDDYFFFIVGGINRAEKKGLDIALAIAKQTGIRLLVAGSSDDPAALQIFGDRCKAHGATFVGQVSGTQKAELFAGAKAVLFPSQYNEACPLVLAESLMSGTPIITSANGAMPELMEASVGCVCDTIDDYVRAIDLVEDIHPHACRALAMERFHYLNMAKGYLAQYRQEIADSRVHL